MLSKAACDLPSRLVYPIAHKCRQNTELVSGFVPMSETLRSVPTLSISSSRLKAAPCNHNVDVA